MKALPRLLNVRSPAEIRALFYVVIGTFSTPVKKQTPLLGIGAGGFLTPYSFFHAGTHAFSRGVTICTPS